MPHLSRAGAYVIFGGVLVAYTVQCELASYLHRSGYSKPYFMLYLTHSSYVLIGVIHYVGLTALRKPIQPLLAELQHTVKYQLLGPSTNLHRQPFPWDKAARRLLALTVLIALPAGIWYAAITLTTMTSLTALYNLNAFWAYILSIYYSKQERWETRSAVSVSIACLGVLVMTYGDSTESAGAEGVSETALHASAAGSFIAGSETAGEPVEGNGHGSLLGDLLGLTSSIACGFYEVWYKRYIALPSNDASVPLTPSRAAYDPLSEDDDAYSAPNGRVKDNDDELLDEIESELSHKHQNSRNQEDASQESDNTSLFLLHANFITASVGVSTILLLWLPIPFLHWLGWEEFGLPRTFGEFLAVAGVCVGGVIFNAGFMILIATWGATATSVGNLFTLILVAASDEVIALLNGYSSLSLSTLIGSGFILVAFGMLMTGPGHGGGDMGSPKTARPPIVARLSRISESVEP